MSQTPSPSLWEYVLAWLAHRLPPGWTPVAWRREPAWFHAVREAAQQTVASPADAPRPSTRADQTPPAPTPRPIREDPPFPTTAVAATVPRPRWGPWVLTVAVLLAVLAQGRLEPPQRAVGAALVGYALAAVLLMWALHRGEIRLAPPPASAPLTFPLTLRTGALAAAGPMAAVAFMAFSGNRFHPLNLTLWAGLLALLAAALLPSLTWSRLRATWARVRTHGVAVRLSPWALLVLAVLALGVFLRFYRLSQVPREMFSDHAEKLYDVMDVLDGQWRIFFPRNTGREGMHMYLGALTARLGAGISYMTLKVPMAVAAAVFLPMVYAWGKLWDGRETGLWAAAFAGVAYWLHMVHRVGLRFMLYPTFAALTLYFLFRGLHRNRRRDFVWAGLFLGLGLHGYSPFRVVPLIVVLTLVWYALHQRAPGTTQRLGFALGVVVLVSVAVFLPLLRYLSEAPEMFFYRMNTRWAPLERPYPGPPLLVFAQNVARAAVMFWWDNGAVWANSVMHRPALDPVTGGLLAVGLLLVAVRYLRHRRWQDGWMLLLIPLLQLPSTLALAFPEENPTLHRTGAAMLPVFLLVGLAAASLQRAWARYGRRAIAWALVGLLWMASWQASHHLVFQEYVRQYRLSNWNTPEIGAVVGGFARSVGGPDQVWVIPYPYWVDTRLVGIEAGFPRKDYALPVTALDSTLAVPGPKLFILKPEDEAALAELWQRYPQARVWRYRAPVEGKDFLLYFVPEE